MPIQSGDVKLLKSAVMADVPEGGGAPTGHAIADGVSNAIFPDISEVDRAGGRVNLRKSFVSVQTDDTDTYFGASKYFSVDLRARYQIDKQLSAAFGVDNANNAQYFKRG